MNPKPLLAAIVGMSSLLTACPALELEDAAVQDAAARDDAGDAAIVLDALPDQRDAFEPGDAAPDIDADRWDAGLADTDILVPDAYVADDAFTRADAFTPDAGAPACVPPVPPGATSGGLTLEGCTLEGLPAGFRVATPTRTSNKISAVTVGNDGRVWLIYDISDFDSRVLAFTPEGPGCTLRFTPITVTGIQPGALDVAADGTLFITSSGTGARSVRWQGARMGSCPLANALGADSDPVDVMEDGRILFPSWTPGRDSSAVVFDTRTCAVSNLPMLTTERTRYAVRLGDDIALDGDGDGCTLQRIDGTTLMREFCAVEDDTGLARDAARCGDDVCVYDSRPSLRRYSGVDGLEVASLDAVTATLPRSGEPHADIDGSPDGRTLVFATTSACESGRFGLRIWRLTGF